MSAFERCLEHTLGIEGGYSDHKNDRGGATKYGITVSTLTRHRKGWVTKEDVNNLSLEEAKRIYEKDYWHYMRLGEVKSETVQLILFDVGVNRGPDASIRNLQVVLRRYYRKQIAVDGIMGPQTLSAMDDVDTDSLARKLIQSVQLDYVEIVKRNPPQAVFLKGWINRTHRLWDACG